MVTNFTYKRSWWGSTHPISRYRGNSATSPAGPSATDRGDYNTLRQSLARSVVNYNVHFAEMQIRPDVM